MTAAHRGSRHPAASPGGTALLFAVVFVNYLVSAPTGVLLDDDGYFVLAAWTGGVAHPPGYPLYTLLAGALAQVPLGTVAWRVHAASALFAALACVVLLQILAQLSPQRWIAWVTAAAFSCTPAFWGQAVIADVYSLNVLCFLALLYLCLFADAVDCLVPRQHAGAVAALLLGLSFSNHWPLMGLTMPALLVAAWPRRRILGERPGRSLALFFVGLLPYAWMVSRSQVADFAFLGPIQGLADFRDYVSRAMYADVDHGEFARWSDRLRYAALAMAAAATQFPWPATMLAAVGFLRQWRVWPSWLCASLVLAFAGPTLLLALVLGFDWDLLHRNTFSVYPLPAYAVLALWLALGTGAVLEWLAPVARSPAMTSVITVALMLVIAGGTWLQQAPVAYRSGDTWAGEFADAVLASLPRDAALFVFGDYAMGPIAYARFVLGTRTDVQLLSSAGQFLPGRLFDPREPPGARDAAISAYIRDSGRPVFYHPVLSHGYGVVRRGLVDQVATWLPHGHGEVRLDADVDRFFVDVLSRGEPRDVSQSIHYRQLTALYCRTLAVLAPAPGADPAGERLGRFCSGFHGLLVRGEARLAAGDREGATRLFSAALARSDEAVTAGELALLAGLAARAGGAPATAH